MKSLSYTILSLFIITIQFACNSNVVPIKTGHEGKQLPEFSLLLSDSLTYLNTSTISKGQTSVFFLFGPNCPFSRAQMQEIVDNMGSFKKVNFYAFTTSPFNEMKSFYNYFNLKSFSNIITGIDYAHFFGKYFKITGVPYIAIYGKDKNLRMVFNGKISYRELKEFICE